MRLGGTQVFYDVLIKKMKMKLYESCFDYRHSAKYITYDGKDWDTELENFKSVYNPDKDFMDQLSRHNLFLLVCLLDLDSDEYFDKCSDILSEVNDT
jgi:hypothetical protein